MLTYLIRRLLLVPVLLFGVSMLIFTMLQLLSPVERASLYVQRVPRNEAAIQGVILRFGLDDPLPTQYWSWLVGRRDPVSGEVAGGILRGDLGYSRTSSQRVSDLIIHRFPATLELALWAIVPLVVGGVLLGILAAVRHNRLPDQFARLISLIGYSLPDFVFGLSVLMFFYANLGWFPPGRLSIEASEAVRASDFHRYTTMNTVDALLNLRPDILFDSLRHLVLPVVTLSFLYWAGLLRVTRSSMLEALRQDFVTTARSKGLREQQVIARHAAPNALIPVATLGGLQVLYLLGGVVITETVFDYPGLGQALADAAVQLDVVTTLGLTLFNAVILVLTNLIVDISYAFIDPRIRLD
jgi:peptide/nickel transport system permease protein